MVCLKLWGCDVCILFLFISGVHLVLSLFDTFSAKFSKLLNGSIRYLAKIEIWKHFLTCWFSGDSTSVSHIVRGQYLQHEWFSWWSVLEDLGCEIRYLSTSQSSIFLGLPEATPTESDFQIPPDLVGFGGMIRSNFSGICSGLVVLVGLSVGFCQTQSALVGFGRILIYV